MPRLRIELTKLAHNARSLRELYGAKGIRITAVTKGVCGSLEIARSLQRSGISSFGDSRIDNIRRMRQGGIAGEFMLIRSPVPSVIRQVVQWADISLNTEIAVIKLLADEAVKQGKVHRVILMVEMGDLREGILPANLKPIVEQALELPGIQVAGIGTNLACFGGICPDDSNMGAFSELVQCVQDQLGIRFELVSGGNSANYQWFTAAQDIGLVNHLRIGESVLLGCDALTREPIPGLYTDAFILDAEVIESKVKPSSPIGTIAQDAFGQVPVFEDRGDIKRAIIALGRQDADIQTLKPRLPVRILGASSDHLVVDSAGQPLAVGSRVSFDIGYSTLLRAMISPYVEKVYIPDRGEV
ncbi:MAG: alanine/ornithine racemase family PLP-dependent enzyme [Chloroflexi bacterium]|nr:alanine/ornithine racemase family PLP-dependent enzyme [Chloroflexota bacterium]